nr:hypothetical protein [Candidatus Njordarchaeota archaeon]
MVGKDSSTHGLKFLKIQLTLMRLAMFSIPIYLVVLSPTSGVYGLSLQGNNSLSSLSLFVLFPVLVFSGNGIFRESDKALGISGAILAILIIINTSVGLYLTVFDFSLLLLFLEVTTTLKSFANVADSIKMGRYETVSHNYRLVLREYIRRAVAIIVITLAISIVAAFLAFNVTAPIGIPGIALFTTITLLVVFAALIMRYRESQRL